MKFGQYKYVEVQCVFRVHKKFGQYRYVEVQCFFRVHKKSGQCAVVQCPCWVGEREVCTVQSLWLVDENCGKYVRVHCLQNYTCWGEGGGSG